MSLEPQFWDDEKVAALSDAGRTLFAYLVTCADSYLLPGLIIGGVGSLSEALRRSYTHTNKALAELMMAELAEVDSQKRLIRIPNAPRYKPPGNGNVIKGWFRTWKRLPESPLKYRHVNSLDEVVKSRSMDHLKAWEATFATIPAWSETVPVSIPKPDREVVNRLDPLPLLSSPSKPPRSKEQASFDLEAVYAEYPRKEGKAEGMALCAQKVKTPEQYEQLKRSVMNYRDLCRREKKERQHILMFSTFMGPQERWLDYAEAPANGARASPHPSRKVFTYSQPVTEELDAVAAKPPE